ncbi:MAG: hypothetical protein ABSF10_13935, partial [Verrucomicrobiota bacterium]
MQTIVQKSAQINLFSSFPVLRTDSKLGFATHFGFWVCAGEAGCHAGESPAGRIGLFTTESWVREEAARPNPKARSRL